MTRVLQIRRGTTTANDNFTGLSGELSFDTDEKTVRVHDGATLGGYTLARADEISGTSGEISDFDIETVAGDFWESIIRNYAGQQFNIEESDLLTIANVSYIENIFNTQNNAIFSKAEMVCQTPEAGYSIGDIVSSFGIGSRTNPNPNTFIETDGLHARLFIASENLWVSHKTTGASTEITNTNWKLKFTVWY